jgi:hypothetical protein
MKIIIVIFIALPITASAGEMWLGEWLQKNEPIVKEYLQNLPDSKIGETIKGVTLTDGKEVLKNATYLENRSNSKTGIYIYKFKTKYADIDYENYYMWSNPGSKKIDFPPCKGEWLVPGGKAALSGDNYTYKSVQPTGQLVVTHCRLSANNTPQPTPKSGAAGL